MGTFLRTLLLAALTLPAWAADAPRLTGQTPPMAEVQAPPMPAETVDDRRKTRSYPDQPPVIPHAIRDYQINLNTNKCLTCHSRKFTEATQAPMISVTHFQDRAGNTLASVAPRRYFCTACHVPQTQADPLVENRFQDMDTVVGGQAAPGKGK